MPGKLSEEGRRKIIAAQKRRWAKRKGKDVDEKTIPRKRVGAARKTGRADAVRRAVETRRLNQAFVPEIDRGAILFNVHRAELVLKAGRKEYLVAAFAHGGESKKLAHRLSQWIARAILKVQK